MRTEAKKEFTISRMHAFEIQKNFVNSILGGQRVEDGEDEVGKE